MALCPQRRPFRYRTTSSTLSRAIWYAYHRSISGSVSRGARTTDTRSMRASTTTSTLKRRKRSSGCQTMRVTARSRKKQVKVRWDVLLYIQKAHSLADLPLRTPSKKHNDEESVASSNKRDSPVLKKAGAASQQRSMSYKLYLSVYQLTSASRTINSNRTCVFPGMP